MHSFNIYLLGTFFVSASILVIGVNIDENKLPSWNLHSSGGSRQ